MPNPNSFSYPKTMYTPACLLAMAFLTLCLPSLAQDTANIEPKANFEVNVNNKTYILAEGENLPIDTLLVKPVFSIKLAPYKTFKTSFVSFQYPANLSYAAENGPNHRQWELSGNDVNIGLHEANGHGELDNLMELMVKKFGRKNCKVTTIYTDIGNTSFSGKQLTVTIAGVSIVFDYYKLPSPADKTLFLFFQDKLNKAGERTAEFERCFAMVTKSIRYL